MERGKESRIAALRLCALGILALGIGLSGVAYRYLQHQLLAGSQARFDAQTHEVQRALEVRLTTYRDLLLGLRGLFQRSPIISRREFHDYVSSLELVSRYPAVAMLNFAQYVAKDMRPSFERAVRGDTSMVPGGYPGFRIVPSGERSEYHVMTYVEPFESNAATLGRDLLRNSAANQIAFAQLRDSGEMATSGEIVSGMPEPMLGLRLALYRQGSRPATVSEHREAFIGSVGIMFSLATLMAEVGSPAVSELMQIRLYSIGEPGSESRLHSIGNPGSESRHDIVSSSKALLVQHRESPAAKGPGYALENLPPDLLHASSQFDFGGRKFEIYASGSIEKFSSAADRAIPFVVLGFGIITSVLVFALIWSLLRMRNELEAAVAERTEELDRSYRDLRSEMARGIRLENEILHTVERERKELGEQLHDDLGQQLTAVAFLAQSLQQDLEGKWAGAAEKASRIGSYLSQAVLQTRTLAKGFYPVAPNPGGLSASLEQLAADSRSIYGIRCEFKGNGEVREYDSTLDLHLYRFAQEAIRNAVRHGKSSAVTIELSDVGGRPRMFIVDNGTGFDQHRAVQEPGIGLQIMRHRCGVLGLEFSIARGQGGGTIVSVA